jgi:hypothetical protein
VKNNGPGANAPETVTKTTVMTKLNTSIEIRKLKPK